MSSSNGLVDQHSPHSTRIWVGDTIFQIPRAMLEQNSEVLTRMLLQHDTLDDPGLSLKLEGTSETFQEVYQILFTYGMKRFENRVLTFIEPLVFDGALQASITDDFSALDVFHAAHELQHSGFIDATLQVLLAGLWAKDPKVSAYGTLHAAEHYKDRKLLGASYYRILLDGPDVWDEAPTLTDKHRLNLARAVTSCGMEWDRVSLHLWKPELGNYSIVHNSHWQVTKKSKIKKGKTIFLGYSTEHLVSIFQRIASCDLPWYDLVGRATIVVNAYQSSYLAASTLKEAQSSLEDIKDNIYIHFEDDSNDMGAPHDHSLGTASADETELPPHTIIAPPKLILHSSMELEPGDLLLRVDTVDFAIPAALAQLHSEKLRDMLSISTPTVTPLVAEPIIIYDSAETVEELRITLMSPLDSFLFQPEKITENLRRSLEFLELLHKYEFDQLEQYVWELVEPMTSKEALPIHLTADLTIWDAFRRGQILDRPGLMHSARAIILERLWAKDPSISPHYLLRFGEDLGDKTIIGAAYYHVVLGGSPAWMEADSLVTVQDCQRLESTRARLAEAWQTMFDSIGQSNGSLEQPTSEIIHRCCWDPSSGYYGYTTQDRVHNLVTRLGRSKTPYFDMMGKIQAVIEASRSCPCNHKCATRYDLELALVREGLYSYYPHSASD
ncbi:hypothetical protein DL93DRAFT_2161208 [Clavulina sp. PMI_390]|nr:hypothetical protein DL93DRAFT_2161208 [Clavulina sp. PMI_390]